MPITETIFGPKRYLTLRKSIAISQISDKNMYISAAMKLGSYVGTHRLSCSGPMSVLYFLWDPPSQKAEIGIALSVEELSEVSDPELSIVDVPLSKSSTDVLRGPYDGLGPIHESLTQYVSEKGYTEATGPVLALEEYVVDPKRDPNPANWVTNIHYLHA
jgi:hypothetical protein